MRLIDADAAVENIEEWLNSVGTALIGKGLSYTGELMGCIEDAPTIDAVPVVRCRECVHCLIDNTERKCHLCMRHNCVFSRKVDLMDFCSYGERKEGADNG